MPETPPPIPSGVIGVGRMGRHHARIYSQLPGAHFLGVVDRSAERVDAITGKSFGYRVLTNDRLGRKYLRYSLGLDGEDNGGRCGTSPNWYFRNSTTTRAAMTCR